MCQWGANRNAWAGYRMNAFQSPRTPPPPNRGVVNWRPHIEHIMWGCRAAWSPLWWRPCLHCYFKWCSFVLETSYLRSSNGASPRKTDIMGLAVIAGVLMLIFVHWFHHNEWSWLNNLFQTSYANHHGFVIHRCSDLRERQAFITLLHTGVYY